MAQPAKKILLLDTGREWGGGTNSMLELLKRIDRQAFDITCCFYYNYPHGNSGTIVSALKELGIPTVVIPQRKQPAWAGVSKELLRAPLFFHRPWRKAVAEYIDRRWRVLPNAQRIRAELQNGNYDVLYMNNQPSTNLEGYLAAGPLASVAVVQHCRIEPQMTPYLAGTVNRYAQALIAVSQGVNAALQASGVEAARCFTVANAIDIHQPLPDRSTVRHSLGFASDTFVFGAIGSLIPRKSLHHILQALAKFHAACPAAKWQMVIVGSGAEHQALARLAIQMGIDNHVIFTGFKNNPLDYLAAFDTFILASKSEGLPRVVLESMLVNTPVTGSRVTGTAELIEDGVTGLLFDYGDTDKLSQHLASLWRDSALRDRLTAAAYQRVCQHYSIEHYVAGVETILRNATRMSDHA